MLSSPGVNQYPVESLFPEQTHNAGTAQCVVKWGAKEERVSIHKLGSVFKTHLEPPSLSSLKLMHQKNVGQKQHRTDNS